MLGDGHPGQDLLMREADNSIDWLYAAVLERMDGRVGFN